MLSRRNLLGLGTGLLVMPASGCAFLLFRLLLGRGLSKGLVGSLRAASLGRSISTLATVGRGSAIGINVARMQGRIASSRTYSGQIVNSSTGELLARTVMRKLAREAFKSVTETQDVQGHIACRTYEVDDEIVLHKDRFDQELGRSYRSSNTTTEHFGPGGSNYVGHDIIDIENEIIAHYNYDGNLVGSTNIRSQSDDGYVADADEKFASYMEKVFEADPLFNCPAAIKLTDRIASLRNSCDQGDEQSCIDSSHLTTKLQLEMSKCKSRANR
jgi:hypothetical protein